MTPAERKALRQIALDQDTTAQALAEEAIRDVLRRHGH
ncbi:ribbon-helix-helix domain-containing protein [Methylobacterium currus]